MVACTTSRSSDLPNSVTADLILTDLRNPRGVAVGAEGGVLVAEAGLGDDAADVTQRTGRFTGFIDRNGDGDFTDPGETERWFEHLAGYNAMNVYATGRDEVSGPSDITVHGDGRVFLSVDVTIDKFGNIFVVEMAADYVELFDRGADLGDPNAPPRHGGYLRFGGKVTVYPQDGSPYRVLQGGLDTPTNITSADDGSLYVSTGRGTPARPIPGPDGPTVIVGQVLRITGS